MFRALGITKRYLKAANKLDKCMMIATKCATSHSLRKIIVPVVHDGACLSNVVSNNDDNAALCLYNVDMNN